MVFGVYQPSSKEGFLYDVPNILRETLIPIIQAYIRQGSVIISDCARVYDSLRFEGYTHFTVNHTEIFVDPITGATTNHVESKWQKLKEKCKSRYGTHRTILKSYLGEFMWCQRFGNSLSKFFEQIRLCYPIPQC
ncbi:hypothetical protein H312_01231 [Anncaliia algerae PRA339]|uniref:ISXO2-like transposase domain-containing protein n=1 Tax=Anncaliia algerae PRA339 TaxID=1288291 RepID=A0A059F2C3_9MICR|nr:hypothetical protein H312_01231 [Anncaliia algerae PRA339]